MLIVCGVGGAFDTTRLKVDELERGTWKSSWVPRIDHPSIAPEHVEAVSKVIVAGLLLAIGKKAYEVSNEWNELLPDYEFMDAEVFLKQAWHGEP